MDKAEFEDIESLVLIDKAPIGQELSEKLCAEVRRLQSEGPHLYGIKQLEPLPEDLEQAGYVTDKILPCPFCGCKTILTSGQQNTQTLIVGYTVFCTNIKCGASTHSGVSIRPNAQREARKRAVEKWNTRTAQLTAR